MSDKKQEQTDFPAVWWQISKKGGAILVRKTRIMVLTMALMLGITGTGLAEPVEFSGDFRLQSRMIDDKISTKPADNFKKNFFEFRARVNFEGAVDQDTRFFGRFSARNYQDLGAETRSDTEFDQYGIKITANDWKFTIGRQALAVGAGSLLDIGSDAAGATNFFDGVVATTKLGDFNVRAFGGKNTSGIYAGDGKSFPSAVNPINTWYGVDLSTQLDKNLSTGLAYLHKKPDTGADTEAVNYWALNAAYNLSPSFILSTEYAKSDKSDKNNGYFLAGTYKWTKDSFTVQYNHVQENAVDVWNGGIGAGPYPFKGKDLPAGYKGVTLAYSHDITKALSFHAIYMDLKALEPGTTNTGSDKEFVSGLSWSF